MVQITHIDPDAFLLDTIALGKKVYDTGFRPKHAISIWRGGTPVGLGVDAYFRSQGIYMNHTSVATESYKGIGRQEEVIVKGLEHVIKVVCPEDELLIVDDVYETGRTIQKIVETLRARARRNAPERILVATVHSKPAKHLYTELPLVWMHEVAEDTWIDYPHELADLYDAADHGEAKLTEKDPRIWEILTSERPADAPPEPQDEVLYLRARDLLYDALRLGRKIAEDDAFYPDFLVALWPGGVSAGLPVHEVIKYLNRRHGLDRRTPDHIAINTTRTHLSYRSNVIGVPYLEEHINDHHNVLILDTVFRSGRMVNDVIYKLKAALRRNLSHTRVRVASLYYNPDDRSTWTVQPVVTEPHYYVRQVNAQVVYPQSFYRLPAPRRFLANHHPELAELVYGA